MSVMPGPCPDAFVRGRWLNPDSSCSLWSVRDSRSLPPYLLKNRKKMCCNFKLDDYNNNTAPSAL